MRMRIYQNPALYTLFSKMPRTVKDISVNVLHAVRQRELRNLETPKVLTFFITNSCNAQCGHCFYWKYLNTSKDSELNLVQIEKVASSLKHPLLALLLTGGEPFVRADVADICQIFSRCNRTSKVIMPTNAILGEKIIEDVNRILLTTDLLVDIVVSVDGLRETAERVRGVKGIFDKEEQTIRLLKSIKDQRLNVYVQTTITDQNYDEIGDLVEYNKKHWGLVHKFQYVRSCNEVYNVAPDIVEGYAQKDGSSALPSLKKIESMNEELKNLLGTESLSLRISQRERELALEILTKKRKVMECVAGVYDAVIYPDGRVSMCEFTVPFGSLGETDYDFHKLWTSKAAQDMRGKIRACACIHSCNLIDSMTHDKQQIRKILA